MRHVLPTLCFLVCAGCGSGGGGGGDDAAPAASATTPVVTRYASGRIHEQGQVVTGTDVRTGTWTRHFDADGSPLQWRGSYTAGAIDTALPWTEWNQDGSVRVDSTDR